MIFLKKITIIFDIIFIERFVKTCSDDVRGFPECYKWILINAQNKWL
jgi:hypothetical protein